MDSWCVIEKKNVIELCGVLSKTPTNQVLTACRVLFLMTHSMEKLVHSTDFKEINQERVEYSLNRDMDFKENGIDIVCFPFSFLWNFNPLCIMRKIYFTYNNCQSYFTHQIVFFKKLLEMLTQIAFEIDFGNCFFNELLKHCSWKRESHYSEPKVTKTSQVQLEMFNTFYI